MKLRAEQFARLVVRPALEGLDLWSPAAEQMVLCTAVTESGLDYIEQVGGGPALGFFQMEPATEKDIWENFLKYKPDLVAKVLSLKASGMDSTAQLAGNAIYAAAMCRLHYRRVKDPLPSVGDLPAMGAYWKRFYNTHQGAGTVDHFLSAVGRFDIQ